MGLPISGITCIGSGICTHPDHDPPISITGVIITGSYNVFGNGKSVSTIGDLVLSHCGHIGVIVTGSNTVFVNNKPCARVTSQFIGDFTGVIITGLNDVSGG